MRIVVAGGTGFIGRALCARLAALSHEVTVLTRGGKALAGTRAAVWDGSGPGEWEKALDGTFAVINLAGESVAAGRWTEARKKALVDSRILSTRALVGAMKAAKAKPKVFISASAVGYYGDRGDTELDETSPPGQDFLAKLCQAWEREANGAEAAGTRIVNLRIGVVLGMGGGALGKMLLPFNLGLGGPLGRGDQWMSWISLEDLVGLVLHLMNGGVSGPVNAAAPHPVTNRDFSSALGKALGRPAFMPAPAFALRFLLGEMADMLLGGQQAVPVKALKANYLFQHPDIDSALKSVLA